MPTQTPPDCTGRGPDEVDGEGLGTPDAAAMVVRIVRGWANDMAGAPKQAQDSNVVLPIDLENAYGRAFSINMLGSREGRLPTASSDLRSAMGTV